MTVSQNHENHPYKMHTSVWAQEKGYFICSVLDVLMYLNMGFSEGNSQRFKDNVHV